MANYIGKVLIGSDISLVGSTLYGICKTPAATAAKTITNINNEDPASKMINTNYNLLMEGTTIHVKFENGNTVTSGVTLLVGTVSTALQVLGTFTCKQNEVISFTLDENQKWIANDVNTDTTYTFATGSTNGTISVTPAGGSALSVSVYGLNNSAYKDVVSSLSDNTTATDLPTANAVVLYVQTKTAGLSGLTGAMHFKGSVNPIPTATDASTFSTYDNGDVILGPNDKEYVYFKGNDAASSEWIELGDEGSYVLQTSQTTDVIDEVTAWSDGTLPLLTVTPTNVSNVSITTAGVAANLTPLAVTVPNVTQAGTATTASVSAGVLSINVGQDTTLGTAVLFDAVGSWTTNTPTVISSTPVTVGSASGWNEGTKPSLTQTPTTVVVPVTTP